MRSKLINSPFLLSLMIFGHTHNPVQSQVNHAAIKNSWDELTRKKQEFAQCQQGIQMKQSRFSGNSTPAIMLALLIACPINVFADNTWSYHQESDNLTNQTYSFAQSPLPHPGLYDNLRLEIVCRENKLQVVIDAENLIASQNSSFDLEYQIDEKSPVTVQMKTFPDSKRKGYSDEFAKRIADDLLTGQAIFIRVKTMIRRILSSSIPLDNAAVPIKHVFADCGIGLPNNEPAYSMTEFEKDFSQLSSEQQQQVLAKIKKIIMEIR
jgi:hypothetical protein